MKSKIFISALSLILGYSGLASAVECCKVNPTKTYTSVRILEANCIFGQKISTLSFLNGETDASGNPFQSKLQIPADICAKVLDQAVAASDCMHNVTANVHTETVDNVEYVRAVNNLQIVGTICR